MATTMQRPLSFVPRLVRRYGALAAMTPKFFLAYSIWVWMQWAVQAMAMTITVYFWRAVYGEQTVIAGLSQAQTLNYTLLALVFSPLAFNTSFIYWFGHLLKEGQIAIELLRPLDFQGGQYVSRVAELVMDLVMQTPLLILAVVVFGVRLPTDPLTWAVFVVSALIGHAVLFFFDWTVACLSFYTTENWGLSVVRYGIGLFASGMLVPLALMPDWLRGVLLALPFAQSLYVPLAFLTGITPLAEAPRLWALQLLALAVLIVVSRAVFSVAIRRVTVQGG